MSNQEKETMPVEVVRVFTGNTLINGMDVRFFHIKKNGQVIHEGARCFFKGKFKTIRKGCWNDLFKAVLSLANRVS